MPPARISTLQRIFVPPRIPSLTTPFVPSVAVSSLVPLSPNKTYNPVQQPAMEPYGKSYFKLLVTDYLSVPDPQPPALRLQLNSIINKQGAPTSWDDVYTLERGLVAVMPELMLRARVGFFRSEFESAATPDEYQEYMRTAPPDSQNALVDKVRADALALIDQIQWRSITIPFFEDLRSQLMAWIVIATGFYTFFALGLLVFLSKLDPSYCFHFLVAVLCGILGGALSTVQRIQAIPSDAGALTNLSSLEGRHFALLASPLIGGTSAALLFYLCASQVLPSSVFPALSSTALAMDLPDSLHAFSGIEAAGYQNAAKLVVWSFVAGFSERFIPDTVSRLTAKLSP